LGYAVFPYGLIVYVKINMILESKDALFQARLTPLIDMAFRAMSSVLAIDSAGTGPQFLIFGP
jgi:hypothetical protein